METDQQQVTLCGGLEDGKVVTVCTDTTRFYQPWIKGLAEDRPLVWLIYKREDAERFVFVGETDKCGW